MGIALDTNILQRARRLDAMQLTVLAAVAQESGLTLVLPEIVLEEAVGLRLREASAAVSDLTVVREKLSDMGVRVDFEAPDPGRIASAWRRDLETRFSIEPLTPEVAKESLLREVQRIPPTREGKGARDAAVWLTVKGRHIEGDEPTYFVSDNVKDFGNPENEDELHPMLAAEVALSGRPFVFARSLTALLDVLAARTDVTLDVGILERSPAAGSSVIAYGQETRVFLTAIDRDLVSDAMSNSYIASPVEAVPLAVRAAQGYTVAGSVIVVAWTDWRLSFEAGALRRFPFGGLGEVTIPVVIEGGFQVWLTFEEAGATVKQAQVTATSGIRIVEREETRPL